MNTITHITPREQALEAENARLLDTVRFQADAVALINETIEGLRADAARYRWLRKKERAQLFSGLFIGVERSMNKWALYGAEADAAIDAAMKESK